MKRMHKIQRTCKGLRQNSSVQVHREDVTRCISYMTIFESVISWASFQSFTGRVSNVSGEYHYV